MLKKGEEGQSDDKLKQQVPLPASPQKGHAVNLLDVVRPATLHTTDHTTAFTPYTHHIPQKQLQYSSSTSISLITPKLLQRVQEISLVLI